MWLDHILSSKLNLIYEIVVLYGTSFDDNIPFSFKLLMPGVTPVAAYKQCATSDMPSASILWDKVSQIWNKHLFLVSWPGSKFVGRIIVM